MKTPVNLGPYPKEYSSRIADAIRLLDKIPQEVSLLRFTNSPDWYSRLSTVKRLNKELFLSLLGDRSEKHLSEFDTMLMTQIPVGSKNEPEYLAILLCKCLYAILQAEKAYSESLLPDQNIREFAKNYVEKVNVTNSWDRLT